MFTMLSLATVALMTVANPEPCGSCHQQQASRWQLSLHAQAAEDPLYLAMREWARQDAGEEAAAKCRTCHHVGVAGRGSAPVPGVTCMACHQGVAQQPGPAGWLIDASAPVRSTRLVDAPHPLVTDPSLTDGRLCLVCHAEMRTPAGVAVCTTGAEAASRTGGPPCTRCHVPAGDHEFPGATPSLLTRAAQLVAELDDGRVRVTVINRGAGHALPTGSVLRQIVLLVTFFDAGGTRIATGTNQPVAVFTRTLADGNGNAPVPPWKAASVASDTRLEPGERRSVACPVPAGATACEVRLVYRRAPVAVLERLGLAGNRLAEPVEMARYQLSLR